MFNFQGSELIIILLLALVVLGPEKLPDAMRRLGRFYADLKKMSTGFQEEFRAAVDEPMRELRGTADTLRDSVDFRKFQEGERAEKPKSAEMAAAGPDSGATAVAPTAAVPFGERADGDGEQQTADGPIDGHDPIASAPETAPIPPRSHHDGNGDHHGNGDHGEQSDEGDARNAAILRQTSTPPAPPAPFASSQAVAPAASVSDVDAGGGADGSAGGAARSTPQVAIEDEHGLREARPADQDGAA